MHNTFWDLEAFKLAYDLAMQVFKISKSFPVTEKYSLTDQINRSSRAVCANMAEAYRKRQYKAHFISKLSDSDMENAETQVWITFAHDCNYLSDTDYHLLIEKTHTVGKILNYMMSHPEKFQRNNTNK